MIERKRFHLVVFLASLLLLIGGAVFLFSIPGENVHSTQVQVVQTLPDLGKKTGQTYFDQLRFAGAPIPGDRETSTLYISCTADPEASVAQTAANLSLTVPDCEMYFLETSDDLSRAMREGTRFPLVITDKAGSCSSYQVVFTGLPVLQINSAVGSGEEGKNWKPGMVDDFVGDVLLTEPFVSGRDSQEALQCYGSWHPRGASGMQLDKKSWKLNLKNSGGGPLEASLLGLPADSGWILNSLNREDTKIREKLFMTLWNEMAEVTPYDSPMSVSAYIEVLMDGRYLGLYLLQKPIDGEYLDLPRDCILFKGGKVTAGPLTGQYKLLQSPIGSNEAYDLLRKVREEPDRSSFHVDNLIDTNLCLQFGASPDNSLNVNCFFIFRPEEQGYRMEFLPWDTDMSFGLSWSETIYFLHDPEGNTVRQVERCETPVVRELYPDFDRRTAARYGELRKTVFDEDHVLQWVDRLEDQLLSSGAVLRDQDRWGLIYAGKDSIARMRQFISDRIQWLDTLYGYRP